MRTGVQIGVSTMHLTGETVTERMELCGHDAFIIDQCDRNEEELLRSGEDAFCVYHTTQRGLSRSRNMALEKANKAFIWLCDDDVRIDPDAEARIEQAFAQYPEADAVCANVISDTPDRPQRPIVQAHVLSVHNAMRYPTYRFVWKRESLARVQVHFDERFGSGAKYTSGEDSLFTCHVLRKGLRIQAVPVVLGHVCHADSQWFSGYTDKYLFDKGALFKAMFGFAFPYCAYMLWRHRNWRGERSFLAALRLMLQGAKDLAKR